MKEVMAIEKLIATLRAAKVRLWIEEGKLKFSAPPGVMTDQLRSDLSQSKAALIEWLQQTVPAAQDETPSIIPVARRDEQILSFGQERLWFLYEMERESPAYNISTVARVVGPLDHASVRQSFHGIVTRHEVLRTTISSEGGRPYAAVARSYAIELPLIDLRDLEDRRREEVVRQLVANETRRPFDLSRGPTLRICLLRTREDEHVLLITVHHAFCDGWSLQVIYRELAAFYEAGRTGRPTRLSPLRIQYADYASWQRGLLSGEELQSQLSYWKGRLQNAPSALELPTDRPRPAVQSFAGARQQFFLSKSLSDSLMKLARREGASLFMTLMAAFQTLLYRYTGQDDVVVGSPIAGRTQSEAEELIGLFMNTLVFRAEMSGDLRFSELLAQVKQRAMEAYEHQHLPFEKLVEELQPERDLSRTPLFQVMFVLQNVPADAVEFSDLRLRPYETEFRTSKFDLTLEMQETRQGLVGSVEYSTDLFDSATINRMLGHFEVLLESVVAAPEERLSELPVLREPDRRQALVEWNDSQAEYRRDVCLHELFSEQVRKTPDRVALVFEHEQVTYQELDARASQVAGHLRELGVGAECAVGVCLDRSVEMVVGLLGVLKAGGAYVPLDPAFPAQRLQYIMADARVAVLLTQEHLLEKVGAHDARVVRIDTDWPQISQHAARAVGGVTPENLAYVTYTSGSTGQPKGVQISHRAVVNFLSAMQSAPGLAATDTFVAVTTISFDISVLELFLPLITGSRLVVVGRDGARDGRQLLDAVQRQRATVMQGTPATWRLLLEAGWSGTDRLKVLCGGQALTTELASQLAQRATAVWNMYGPTETTVWSTCDRIDPHGGVISIGRPIANTQVYVLDRALQPLPVGVAGEFYIAGDGLSRGYAGLPNRTAGSFVPNPFGSDRNSQLYRTGDKARYLGDGRVECLGRTDDQVKVRGYRIELGDIEAALEQHPAIRQAAVVIPKGEPGAERLCAFYVGDHDVESGELRASLADRLPAYMVPSTFVRLDALPLTPNRKVDRRALSEAGSVLSDRAEVVLPRNTYEEMLADIWGQVLRVERVGVYDNFFALGGHSLLAMQVMSRISQVFQVVVPVRALFETATVAGLAERIQAAKSQEAAGGTATLVRADRTARLPLSFAQQRLWFLNELDPASAAYNLPAAVHLTGRLDVPVLAMAFQEVVRRHEVLRTTFAKTAAGEAHQVIATDAAWTLGVVDLRALPVGQRAAVVPRLAHAEAQRPFDLTRGPLLRARVLQLADEEHVLLFTQHHIVGDGWSGGVIVREVLALQAAFQAGVPSPLDELGIQYADYAVWQRQWLASGVMAAQLAYWKAQLQGAPASLELPTDRPRPAVQSFRGARQNFALSRRQSAVLMELSRQQGVTLFMTVLAAYQVLLHRYSGQRDILVGSAIAGRTERQTEELIGFFVNTLVLRADLRGDPSFRDFLIQTRQRVLDAFANQHLPFDKLVEELEVQRDLSKMALFQAMLIFQNTPQPEIELPGVRASALDDKSAPVRSDLDLYVWESEDGIRGSFVYSIDLFDESTVARLSHRFITLLESIAAEPAATVGELPLDRDLDLATVSISSSRDSRGLLSSHQERMWFIDQFETGNVYESNPTYHNLPLVLHFQGGVDTEALQRAINAVVVRHDVLRTRFVAHEGHAYQEVLPHTELRVRDVPANRDGDASELVVQLALEETQIPIALDRDPLIRASLFRLADASSVLVVTVHHIAADTQSLRLMADEIAEHYRAHAEDRAPRSPDLPVRYMDHAKWQRAISEDAIEQLLFYWKRQLAGPLQALTLPTRRVRPAVHTYSVGRRTSAFSEGLSTRIDALGRAEQTGTFEVLLAAFNVLLRRYSGHDEIVVGTSASCRRHPAVRNAVGPFANLVVLRSYLGGDPSFSAFLKQVARTVRAARRHEDMPFDRLVKELNPQIDMSRTALFDVLFRFDDAPPAMIQMGQTRATLVDTNFGHGKYDINLSIQRTAAGFSATWVYNTDLFDEYVVAQMAGHLEALLECFTSDSDRAIDDVDLLSQTERRTQLVDWNSTDAEFPRAKTIHGIFEEQAARYPDRIAVVFEQAQLTYRELDEQSNRLANHLREQGVRQETLVALCLGRTSDMIVAILGVLKAGGAYLPIDPDYPDERRSYIVEDSRVTHVVSTSNSIGVLVGRIPSLILLDSDHEVISRRSSRPPAIQAVPDNIAYCIYTSGSTGKPKGVLLEHRQVVRLMVNDHMPFTFTEDDVWSMFHSYCFDFSVWEMYGALLYGGKLVIVSQGVNKDPQLFLDLIRSEEVTVLNQTPGAFLQLMHHALSQRGANVPVRYVIFGGEALAPRLLQPWNRQYPDVKLVNMYGITETTVHVTFKELGGEDLDRDASNIGGPIPTLQTYLVDSALRLLPVGVPGELYVGGAGLARNYLDRPELTAERFVPNLFGGTGDRLYKTGDLGRYQPDGNIEFLGRMDHQVKIRGFRIEVGEIEAALAKHPEVREAVVLARQDKAGGKRLVAYLTTDRKMPLSTRELRDSLKNQLPEYMVPTAFVTLDSFPLTSNRKVDRRALPEPEAVTNELEETYVAPSTPQEEILVEVWSQLLGIDRVGVHDNFFDQGGHSLLATQLVSRVREAFKVDVPVRALFENPTVAGLAAVITAAGRSDPSVGLPPVSRGNRTGALPLSYAQQRLWLLDRMEPGNPNYNMPGGLRLRGWLNVQALNQGVDEIVRRHDVLRGTFSDHDGTPVQMIVPPCPASFPIVDLRLLPPEERERTIVRLTEAEARRPFNLDQGPLLRIRLLQLGEQENVILFTMHHIVCDGWSIGLFARELSDTYQAFSNGGGSQLSELPLQYSDFAAWQRQWLQGDALEAQLDYWRRRLGGQLPVLHLPRGQERPALPKHEAGSLVMTVSAPVTTQIKQLCRQEKTTLFMTLLAAFQALLHQQTGDEDIVVGTDLAGRNDVRLEELIGFFVNLLVMRTDLSGNPTFSQLLHRVRETALGAYAHQDVPFVKLVEELQPQRHVSNTPLFQVLFVMQNTPMQALELPGLTFKRMQAESGKAKFDLAVFVAEAGEQLVAEWIYDTDLYTASQIGEMAQHYENLLRLVVTDPGVRLKKIVFQTQYNMASDPTDKQARRDSKMAKLKKARQLHTAS